VSDYNTYRKYHRVFHWDSAEPRGSTRQLCGGVRLEQAYRGHNRSRPLTTRYSRSAKFVWVAYRLQQWLALLYEHGARYVIPCHCSTSWYTERKGATENAGVEMKNEWKCEDFKCVWKPTESRLCLTHYMIYMFMKYVSAQLKYVSAPVFSTPAFSTPAFSAPPTKIRSLCYKTLGCHWGTDIPARRDARY